MVLPAGALSRRLTKHVKKVGDDFTKLAWQVNVDLIQHQKWHSDPLHQQAKAELITLFEQTVK